MTHLDDGELLRYVDGELGPAEAGRWEAHVAACERCNRAVQAVLAESRLVSDWLTLADFEADLEPAGRAPVLAAAGTNVRTATLSDNHGPARTPWGARPSGRGRRTPAVSSAWLKAAAIVLLVAGPLAALPGVRGWVFRQVGMTGGTTTTTTTAVDGPVSPVIRFEPAAGSFTIRFEADIAEGALALERAGATGAVEAVLRMDGAAEPVVAERVLRILDAEPGTRLTLVLPAAVTDVRVFLDTREVRVSGEEIDAGRTVRLDG